MDIAVSLTSSDHATSPYEPLRPVANPASPSLQSHRAGNIPSAHSPRRFHAPATRTPPALATLEATEMDLSPAGTTHPARHSAWPDPDPTPDGQDHDRMETDDDSSSEDDLANPQDNPTHAAQNHLQYHEVMDTTPDEPHWEENVEEHVDGNTAIAPSPSPSPPLTTSHEHQTSSEPRPLQDTSVPQHLTSSEGGTPGPPQPELSQPQIPQEVTASDPMPPTADAHSLHDTVSRDDAGAPTHPPPEDSPPTPAPGDHNNHDNRDQQQDREDSSQEESSDEEERPYWAEFVEDTSAPDEQELLDIGLDGSEVDATDHAHWESKTYEALEDPEHVPADTGRILWVVTPVNGTPANPNREKVMRSPSVLIGGLYWNIKYYPRGNDGTENMSVYIECSPGPDSEEDPTPSGPGGAPASSAAPQATSESPEAPQTPHSEADGCSHWEAAAQIGCVVYNPGEPRVNVFRKSSHRFIPQNADWGWTRFHGPWESIHVRQRNERQALLRNDTLVFTAYIRMVKDETKSLWYHAPKQGLSWDSYERIGVKSLATGSSRDNAIIAAISCWLNLKPFVDFIRSMKIPDALKEPQERNRPLFRALQRLLEYMFGKPKDTDRRAMKSVVKWIDWYTTESYPSRIDMPDVVAVWESLRRMLNLEASGLGDIAAAPDCFQDVLLLRQPNPWAAESPISTEQDPKSTRPSEPRSVQETIDLTLFKPWQCFTGNVPESDELPAVLQVELHRQRYDKEARRWDKLTHRVELNENITYTSPKTHRQGEYTLYGFVVHSGALESHDFYSVVRPQGPGTRWIRYSGGNSSQREAVSLTSTQAIAVHEGKGEEATGTAAVAYVVLYVRTDAMSDILLSLEQSKPPVSATVASNSASTEDSITVRVYNSTLFDNHVGRGLPDLWTANPQWVRELRISRSSTLADVWGYLDAEFLGTGKVTEAGEKLVSSWHCIDTGLVTARGLPHMTNLGSGDTLERAIVRNHGCRLWLHSFVERETSPESTDTVNNQSAETRAHPDAPDTVNDPDASMAHDEQLAVPVDAQAGETASPIEQTSANVALLDQPGHEPEDAVMEGTQDGAAHPSMPSSRSRGLPRIYFFVKIFDSQAQTLRAVCSHEASLIVDVHAQVGRLLGCDDPLDLYVERSRSLSEHDRVRPSSTFEDLDPGDGCVLIAHRRPSLEEILTLVAQGKHPDPINYFHYLRHNDNPAYLISHNENNYFGTSYHSVNMSYGLFHGQGTLISRNGDAYVGNFVSDMKSGHGTMAYASGDTYTGEFAQDERNGQGKMVYGKTHNVYVGGWKKGRRHGKGVMTYEVADEEMEMCKICYENETDALFYDCGHVVACEECARQVDMCPVCRKSVRGVCRIWKT